LVRRDLELGPVQEIGDRRQCRSFSPNCGRHSPESRLLGLRSDLGELSCVLSWPRVLAGLIADLGELLPGLLAATASFSVVSTRCRLLADRAIAGLLLASRQRGYGERGDDAARRAFIIGASFFPFAPS
jgi:hypothetical protein